MMLTRRPLLAALVLGPLAPGVAFAQRTPVTADEMVLGKADAPLTLIEYASMGCGACGAFHNQTMPALKAKYIDTGRMKLAYREVLAGDANFAMAGILLARGAGAARYFEVIENVYRYQQPLLTGGRVREGLLEIARSVGMSEAEFEAALRDENVLDAAFARTERFVEQDQVRSTPTFIMNKQRLVGHQTLAQMDAFIASAG